MQRAPGIAPGGSLDLGCPGGCPDAAQPAFGWHSSHFVGIFFEASFASSAL